MMTRTSTLLKRAEAEAVKKIDAANRILNLLCDALDCSPEFILNSREDAHKKLDCKLDRLHQLNAETKGFR